MMRNAHGSWGTRLTQKLRLLTQAQIWASPTEVQQAAENPTSLFLFIFSCLLLSR